MAQRWYYRHGDRTHGPVDAEALQELVERWQLGPTDLVWAEWESSEAAVPAREMMPYSFQQPAPEAKAVPEWLGEVDPTAPEPPPAAPAPPRKRRHKTRRSKVDAPVPVPVAHPVSATPVAGADPAGLPQAEPLPVAEPVAAECRFAVGSATAAGHFVVLQGSGTNRGRPREVVIVIVADDVGGPPAGEQASGLVVETMGGVLAPLLAEALAGRLTQDAVGAAFDRAFVEAHRAVTEAAQAGGGGTGLGATAVALALWGGEAHIALVGDCRVYHQRGSRLTRVTREQTLVARMVEEGQLTPEEAAKHPRRTEVTQAVGVGDEPAPVHQELELSPGDCLLATSAGLYTHVEDRAIQEALAQSPAAPGHLVRRLVKLAGKGRDGRTAVAVYCH